MTCSHLDPGITELMTRTSTRAACHSDARVSPITQDAAKDATRCALAQHAAEGKAALAAAMEAQGKAAQAATDKTQRLLVAALLRHQKANEAAAAATLRTEDARARVVTWLQHRAGLLSRSAFSATNAMYNTFSTRRLCITFDSRTASSLRLAVEHFRLICTGARRRAARRSRGNAGNACGVPAGDAGGRIGRARHRDAGRHASGAADARRPSCSMAPAGGSGFCHAWPGASVQAGAGRAGSVSSRRCSASCCAPARRAAATERAAGRASARKCCALQRHAITGCAAAG